MISRTMIGTGTAVILLSGVAFAQSTTVTVDQPPDQVITYVQKAPMPSTHVEVKETVAVGQALPETVEVTPVPDDSKYGYAIVNDERVIVEPSSRTVIQVLH